MNLIKTTLAIVFLMASLAACKKEKANPPDPITGYWEIAELQQSITPPVTFEEGNGKIYKFANNGYEYYENRELKKSGTYSIENYDTGPKNECGEVQFTSRIIFDNNTTDSKIFFEISNAQLTFSSGCFMVDGGVIKKYKKVTGL